MNRGCLESLAMGSLWVALVVAVTWLGCWCFEVPFRFRYALGVMLMAATARTLMVGITVNQKH